MGALCNTKLRVCMKFLFAYLAPASEATVSSQSMGLLGIKNIIIDFCDFELEYVCRAASHLWH